MVTFLFNSQHLDEPPAFACMSRFLVSKHYHAFDVEVAGGAAIAVVPSERAGEEGAEGAPQGEAAVGPGQRHAAAVRRPADGLHLPRKPGEVLRG